MANLQLGEEADEADWRALVEKGLKGASWGALVGATADGIELKPLYRESDVATADDASGAAAALFVRGGPLGAWAIRQCFEHPDPERTNCEILADLKGGVGAIELKMDPSGEAGVAINDAAALDVALAGVILEAAPVSLDAGPRALRAADLLAAKLKGVAAAGTAFNLDPIGALMRTGVFDAGEVTRTTRFAQRLRQEMPGATALRIDARPIHEAGGTDAQEIAAALASGAFYLRALTDAGMRIEEAAVSMAFACAIETDVLVEVAKLRALRLCWERMLEASGAQPIARGARIHAFSSRRMMTRHDAHTNILRVTAAAFAAAVGGADAITTLPFTDALGLPTAFARRVARNTQLVLMEEARLGQVKDPAGGAWFVEKLTRELAEKAWTSMQAIEAKGGIAASLEAGRLQGQVAVARAARQAALARRKEAITGATDFPLLGEKMAETALAYRRLPAGEQDGRQDAGGRFQTLSPIRWAAPFEALRERAEGKAPRVFFATLGPSAEFSARAQFAANLFAVGGVAGIGADAEFASPGAAVAAFEQSDARVAAIAGADARYADNAATLARGLKAAGATWVALAGKPGEREAEWREAGVDQFVYAGVDVVKELETLHAALGVA